METITAARLLDRRNKTITTFVVYDIVTELRSMNQGEVVEVLTDEFEPFERDIAAWCDATGHKMVGSDSTPEGHRFIIEKGNVKQRDTSLAMVVSTAGLEELLSPLGFALGAALEGIDVHLFFQGPAVRVLAQGFRPKLGGWARPMSRFAAAGMAKAGHIPAQAKLDQLRSLGTKIYMCGPSMQHFKVKREDLIFDDLPLVEYLTFMAVMERADMQVYT